MPVEEGPVQTFVERRRSPRAPVTVRVEYASVDALFAEFSRDINEGGMFIETESPLAIDERVQLWFRLPGSEEPIKVSGRVAWVDETIPGMGIEFAALDEEARARINRLVRELRATEG
jgi:type IV pilus assembly protein PilZ